MGGDKPRPCDNDFGGINTVGEAITPPVLGHFSGGPRAVVAAQCRRTPRHGRDKARTGSDDRKWTFPGDQASAEAGMRMVNVVPTPGVEES